MLCIGDCSHRWEADCRKEQNTSHTNLTSSAQKNTPLLAQLLVDLVFHLVKKNGDKIPPLLPLKEHISMLQGGIKAASL